MASIESELLSIYGIGQSTVPKFAAILRRLNPHIVAHQVRNELIKAYNNKQIKLSALTWSDLKYNPIKKIKRSIIVELEAKIGGTWAGSYRRGAEHSRDLDIIMSKTKFNQLLKMKSPQVTEPIIIGEAKAMIYIYYKGHYYKADIYFSNPIHKGALLLYLTGSFEYNIILRKRAKQLGMLLNQDGLYKGKKLIASKTERDIFRALDLPYRQPIDRNIHFRPRKE
jgi:DNA polymerase (family 10)